MPRAGAEAHEEIEAVDIELDVHVDVDDHGAGDHDDGAGGLSRLSRGSS